MSVFRRIADTLFPKLERSSTFPLSKWIQYIGKYGLTGNTLSVQGRDVNTEGAPNDYEAFARRFYKSNAVVYAVTHTRMRVFSQIRFKWRLKDGQNTEHALIDRPDPRGQLLDILDSPAPGLTTYGFLSRAIQDIDVVGNAFWTKERMPTGGMRLRRLRPDWVDIVLSAPPDQAVQSDVIGYIYYPGGYGGPGQPRAYLPEEVAHWAPEPDPEAQYRGMSPLSALMRDLMIEESANEHRISFFRRGAQPNFAVVLKEKLTEEQLDEVQDRFVANNAGVHNAYSPFFVGAGADIVPVETNVSDLDMKNLSGRAETHIAGVFGVHPTVVGLSEGLAGSSLNSGNYKVAARGFINQTMHPLWQSLCESLESIVPPPERTRRKPERLKLWYSASDVSILNDDREERAKIRGVDAETMDKLVREGWTPDSVKKYIVSGNPEDLVHSGFVSVQLYDPTIQPSQGTGGSNLAPGGNAPEGDAPVPNVDPKASN